MVCAARPRETLPLRAPRVESAHAISQINPSSNQSSFTELQRSTPRTVSRLARHMKISISLSVVTFAGKSFSATVGDGTLADMT